MKSISLKRVFHQPLFWLIVALVLIGSALLVKAPTPLKEYQSNLVNSSDDQSPIRMVPPEKPVFANDYISVPENLRQIVNAKSEKSAGAPADCLAPENTLVLENWNVVLTNIRYRTQQGQEGCGKAIPHTDSTGHFWFFNPNNIELTLKTVDGITWNQHYWVFGGALTNVEWWADFINNANPNWQNPSDPDPTHNAGKRSYHNPMNQMASFGMADALVPGPNNVPVFNTAECGKNYEITRNSRGVASGNIGAFLYDPQGEPLTATVRNLKDSGAYYNADWILNHDVHIFLSSETGPIIGTGIAAKVNFSFPQPGEYLFGIEATDGKILIPPVCTFRFIVK